MSGQFSGGGCDHTLEYLKSTMFIRVSLLNIMGI